VTRYRARYYSGQRAEPLAQGYTKLTSTRLCEKGKRPITLGRRVGPFAPAGGSTLSAHILIKMLSTLHILFNTSRFNLSTVGEQFINPCCFGEDAALLTLPFPTGSPSAGSPRHCP
jgi:hypothetical protein